jgi:hypothetical protein
VVTLTFDSLAQGTRFSLTHGTFATEARLALHRSGWTDSLVKLRGLLESETCTDTSAR